MPQYALVETAGGQQVVKRHDFEPGESVPRLAPNKGLTWLPVVTEGDGQAWDPQYQTCSRIAAVERDAPDGARVVDRWVVADRPLEEIKIEHRARIREKTALLISSGIASNALGQPHSYPTLPTDQTNLMGLVIAGAGGKFWCADSQGVWERHLHTTEQLHALGEAVKAHVVACQDAHESALAAIETANTAADVVAVSLQPSPQ